MRRMQFTLLSLFLTLLVSVRRTAAETKANTTATVRWYKTSRFLPCSTTCGPGYTFRVYVCGTLNLVRADDDRCVKEVGPKPEMHSRCHNPLCPPAIRPDPWGPCNQCHRNRTLRCVRLHDDGFKTLVPIEQCNVTSLVETEVCSSYDCQVAWRRTACCHGKTDVLCVFNGTVLVKDYLCEKFTHVLKLHHPPDVKCPDLTCGNDTWYKNMEPETVTEAETTAGATTVTTTPTLVETEEAKPSVHVRLTLDSSAAGVPHSAIFVVICSAAALLSIGTVA